MYIEFEVTHGGRTFEVHGNSEWVGETPPSYGPDPTCTKCHGEGQVKIGYDPPDEFNATGQDVYDACDCSIEVDPGQKGHPDLTSVALIDDTGNVLTAREVTQFVTEFGYNNLATAAHEALIACHE